MAINLEKGQRIDLTKKSASGSTSALSQFCVGVNWGMIEKKGLFGGVKKEAVDLDASCALFNAQDQLLDAVYFNQLSSQDGSIQHSGDDREGDADGDDGLDNEIISVDLTRLSSEVETVVFFLNSYNQQDFATVPFAAIRLYEGTPERVTEIFATYEISTDTSFRGYVAMVMGKLYKRNGEWKFSAIGEPTPDKKLADTITTIQQKYL